MKYLKILFFLLTTSICVSTYAQSPNIILIIADDLGVDAIKGYDIGSIHPNTPNLDKLRNSGVNFTNTWSSPVCTPTRAGIMSGKYGSKTGVKTVPGNLDTSHISVLNALKTVNSNYKAAVIGKWHIAKPSNAAHPISHGADHFMGVLDGAVADYSNWSKTENGITALSTSYVSSYFTDNAINWIKSQNNPWLLWFAPVAPHTPLHVPPSNMFTQTSTNTPFKKYLAMIESLDYEVGRLLESLTPTEKANTTIIFVGDNGTPNNTLQDYPAKHGKESLYEGGIHVPMFVSGNGVTRIGETENALVNVIDIYATIVKLGGSNLAGGIYNSLSFKHLLTSSTLPKRKYNFTEIDANGSDVTTQGYAIRNNTYKLIEYSSGIQEMYNLVTDKLETTNLILGTLTTQEKAIKLDLENEAAVNITGWSCKDDIMNGSETGVDTGASNCSLSTKIDSQNDSDIIIYPNPTKDLLTIKTNLPYEVTISTITGQVTQTISINTGSSNISLKDYIPGVYFVSGSNNTNRFVKKIIVKK